MACPGAAWMVRLERQVQETPAARLAGRPRGRGDIGTACGALVSRVPHGHPDVETRSDAARCVSGRGGDKEAAAGSKWWALALV
ncbi:hypothetical protein E2562_020374 [Oryza meyeriana var. granulata]|uniref:Uncharacterized protein n=1 Tax=Oryza meyeriana var. granulata TaxID=110450 RepID=A0A6G1DLD3_9ORYZ|nr:hypothetical protein E2562_020374 [Oryza meyeriana var. granulata]